MQSGARFTLYVHLDDNEQFRAETRTGPIMVNRLGYGSHAATKGQASITGPAIKKDGDRALFNRDGSLGLLRLPIAARREIIKQLRALSEELHELADEQEAEIEGE